jgi:alkylated DNA repair dioxygenase AlkB
MGLHQDRDEADLAAPVVSISLGDTCLFRCGGTSRSGGTKSLKLQSGDVVVIGGAGKHSAFIPTFGATLSVTRALKCVDGKAARSVEDFHKG